MKNVISMVFFVMLVTFLFCGCSAVAEPAPAAEPTLPPVYTQTETLFFTGHVGFPQKLESTYDQNGALLETQKTEFHESGAVSAVITAQYDAAGNVTYYREIHERPDGSTDTSLVKHYDAAGNLTKQVTVSYREDGNPGRIETRSFSGSGMLLTRKSTGYFADGSLCAKESEYYDPETDYRFITGETHHENGQLASFCDGVFDPETYELLDGTMERFDSDGAVIESKTAQWDAGSRSRSSSFVNYEDNSSGWVTECFDDSGCVIVRESVTYEEKQVLFEHYIENNTYSCDGLLLQQSVQYYLDGGVPAERFETACRYDETGTLICEETAQYLASGKRQNLAVTEYTYDASHLIKSEQTSYDHKDIRKSCLTKEYDVFGALTTFTTVSASGNSHSYSYTYDEEGRVQSELLTTRYHSGRRIDYQEIAYEYHGNGLHKSVSVHLWTSYDEAGFPDKAKNDLGTTTVTHYDEDGNKIK